MPDQKSEKLKVVISGGMSSVTEENQAVLLDHIRKQYQDPNLEWDDLDIVDDPELTALMMRMSSEEETDPHQKYWDTLILQEAMGIPRVYH
jgi:hypothetical protein